ncbi:hypothetical protein P3X46_022263 [Hevea brasiliensis]|uniref:CCHC-type domain-containing protein n=1 Tax=Hevea brasiliensis TaxID=3981 RepID=A0ABQ9L929_HEVBR|nr:hypothetical protein P3X46_022263 [Hevea brasiliensis]
MEEDYQKALYDGPWVVLGSYLFVKHWSMEFDHSKEEVESIMAWIRLLGLPIHFYRKQVLREIEKVVGLVTKVDCNTSDILRGKFVRLVVFVNFREPLVLKFLLNENEQVIKYECLMEVCFQCGRYGHPIPMCTFKGEQSENNEDKNGVNEEGRCNEQEGKGSYGPWIVISRRGRSNQWKAKPVIKGGGSRFQILREHVDEEGTKRGEAV